MISEVPLPRDSVLLRARVSMAEEIVFGASCEMGFIGQESYNTRSIAREGVWPRNEYRECGSVTLL